MAKCDLCQKEFKGKSHAVIIERAGSPQNLVEDLDSVCKDCAEKIMFFIESLRKPEKKAPKRR